MKMDEAQGLKERAQEFLDAAKILMEAGLLNAAFDDARHASELAGKSLLLLHEGSYPRKHQIAGELSQAGLIPQTLAPKQVSKVLGAWTAGRYGFSDRVGEDDTRLAIKVAEALIAETRG